MEEHLASFTFLIIIIHLREMAIISQILIFLSNIPKNDIVHIVTIILWLNEKNKIKEYAFPCLFFLSTVVVCFEPAIFSIWLHKR